jgi:TolB-like protein
MLAGVRHGSLWNARASSAMIANGFTKLCTYTIQEIQVIAPPKRQVYTGAPLRGPNLSLNMHSQQSMNYSHWVARGDVASAAIPVSISVTAAQWRTGQHTAADRYARIGRPSLIES